MSGQICITDPAEDSEDVSDLRITIKRSKEADDLLVKNNDYRHEYSTQQPDMCRQMSVQEAKENLKIVEKLKQRHNEKIIAAEEIKIKGLMQIVQDSEATCCLGSSSIENANALSQNNSTNED